MKPPGTTKSRKIEIYHIFSRSDFSSIHLIAHLSIDALTPQDVSIGGEQPFAAAATNGSIKRKEAI